MDDAADEESEVSWKDEMLDSWPLLVRVYMKKIGIGKPLLIFSHLRTLAGVPAGRASRSHPPGGTAVIRARARR